MSTAFSWNENHVTHASAFHPERPERVQAILKRLQENPLWDQLEILAPLPVGRDEAALVHTDAYLDRLETATAYAAQLDPDTYTTHRSLEAAYASLGSVLAITNAVMTGEARNGFAACRPPGHHATPNEAMGFCLLSNAAIAARWAQEKFGIERVAIMDFDVHHGNGTQDAFYDDGSVLYMSTHQAPLYPGTGRRDERGTGAGEGTTLNVPLASGSGDREMEVAFRDDLAPAIEAFQPELLLVSAGYDAHWRDPLAGLNVTTHGFGHLVRMLVTWAETYCGGRLVGILEGGYDAQALATSVIATISRLIDPDAPVHDPIGAPR